MTCRRLIPTVAATALCALAALPAGSAAAATATVQQSASANWAGYAVAPAAGSQTRFRTVAGSWVVPSASCTSGAGNSSFWVGLGGSGAAQSSTGTDSLEQAGTETDCSATGQSSQFAWYELVPSAPVRIPISVHAGDHISSRVTVNGDEVTISLSDATTGAHFVRALRMSDPDTSTAEWIAEAPSSCTGGATGQCTPLPLADFGRVAFSSAMATTTSGHAGTISDPAFSPTALTLSPAATGSGETAYEASGSAGGGATPSSLSSDGSSFEVTWQSISVQGSAASSGYGTTGDGLGSGDGYGTGYGYGPGDGYGDPYAYGPGTGPYGVVIVGD